MFLRAERPVPLDGGRALAGRSPRVTPGPLLDGSRVDRYSDYNVHEQAHSWRLGHHESARSSGPVLPAGVRIKKVMYKHPAVTGWAVR